MLNKVEQLELGTILCKHCETIIGTFDAEKVTFYYSDCQEPDCHEERVKKAQQQDVSDVRLK